LGAGSVVRFFGKVQGAVGPAEEIAMKSILRTLIGVACVGGSLVYATAASAQDATDKGAGDKGKGSADQRGVITLAEVTITGRIQKPIAAVDVSRIQPKLTLAELRQPFLERIEKAIYSDPF
jgi:hypothetical protein